MSLYSQLRMHVFSRVIVRLCIFHMHSQARTFSLPSSPLTVTRGPRFSRTVIWILSEPTRFTIPATKRIVYVITHTIIHTFYESYNRDSPMLEFSYPFRNFALSSGRSTRTGHPISIERTSSKNSGPSQSLTRPNTNKCVTMCVHRGVEGCCA